MAIIGSRSTWKVQNAQTRQQRGPLIRVQTKGGGWVKMYEMDAIEAGLVPGKAKAAPPPENKLAPGPVNKAPTGPAPEPEPDDFTAITGVGKASARSLVAQGIRTFEALRAADLDRLTLNPNVRKAVEEWRA